MKRIHLTLSIVIFSYGLIAQSYKIGLNPPTIQWKYIENDAAKIIYQEGIYVSGRNDFRGYKSKDATLYHKK